MTCYILIRQFGSNDLPMVSSVVRNAYISNVTSIWLSTLCNEVTFQAIVLLGAFMFIFMGVPFLYCFLAVPLVPIISYVLIYGVILMKAAELMYNKKPLCSWVAVAYEPYFFTNDPQNCSYSIRSYLNLTDLSGYKSTIIGTCSVMKHNYERDGAWLYRLAVEKKYRRKGIGGALIQAAIDWCRDSLINFVELTVTESQEEARQLFINSGFQYSLCYHKKLCMGAFTLQMFQMRCKVRSTY